jgi:hypothetical protein
MLNPSTGWLRRAALNATSVSFEYINKPDKNKLDRNCTLDLEFKEE